MRFTIKTAILLAYSISLISAADMDWQAQFRARLERPDKFLEDDISATTLIRTRSRLMFRMQQDYLSAAMQFQEVHILGAEKSNSGLTKPDSTHFGLHQVYMSVDQLFSPGWNLTIGRFEVNLGNQRLFSSNNWNNYGRSFDGIRLQSSGRRFGSGEIFSLKIHEAYSDTLGDDYDSNINGIYLRPITLKLTGFNLNQLEIYGYQELNRGDTSRRLFRTTYGSRLNLSVLILGFEIEAARQVGKDQSDFDIDAWFTVTNLEVRTGFIPIIKKITFGHEYFTGDDISTLTREGFANPYGAGHKYHGYFDNHTFFRDNLHTGLKEWNIKINLTFKPQIGTVIKYHNFRTSLDNGEKIGNELDLEYIQKIGRNGSFIMGYSVYNYGPASGTPGAGEMAYTVLSITL